MHDNKQIDDIMRDIKHRKVSQEVHEQDISNSPLHEEMYEDAKMRRAEQVKNFSLNVEFEDISPTGSSIEQTNEKDITTDSTRNSDIANDQNTLKPVKPPKQRRKKNNVWGRILYALFVILLSVSIAGVAILYFFDASGINASSEIVAIEIPSGAYTKQIAEILTDKGVITNPLFFRIYSKVTKSDGLWQVGTFMLSADMGYSGLVQELQTATPRANVNVTIPEGFTVEEIAALLEEKEVCSKEEFYYAVINGEYDYDFVKAIPTAADGKEYAGRIYRLEGYLFPDTYNFYIGSTGEMVVERMLSNFNKKLTPEIRQQITNKGWTIDQAITFASIVQGEAGLPEDMVAVSRVLTNRLQPDSGYPKLECCSTRDYVNGILPTIPGVEVTTSPYDTYIREGLPVGAINNPGMLAIRSALNPSEDEQYANCYFFATDYDTGITYFSETFSQHVAICRKYKIGIYG